MLFAPKTIARDRFEGWRSTVAAAVAAVEDDGDREELSAFLRSVELAGEIVVV